MHKILILGPQGSGKGTQADRLAKKLNIPALSMGNLFRNEVASESKLGNQIKDILDRGELVSDEIALNVLKKRLELDDAQNGYILDGYPRNYAQYQTYKRFDMPTSVIVIEVSREESLKRIMKRAEIESRSDDTPEAIEKRLKIYEDDTRPIISHYKEDGIVHIINGVGSMDEVEDRINQFFN